MLAALLLASLAAAASAPPDPSRPTLAPREDAVAVFAPRDPRVGRWFGFGTHMGLAGLSGLTVGARVLGVVNPTVTVAPLGTLDATLRLNLLPRPWSPQIGAGYVINYPAPLWGGSTGERCAIPHVDAGVEFVPGGRFTLDAGMSLGVADCSGDTRLLPIPYVASAWYFGRR